MTKIINLTRKFIAPISSNPTINLSSINSMPEMVLDRMIKRGDKSIIRVGMNSCVSSVIKKDGITTMYTDALSGCNSVAAVFRFTNGQKFMLLSHYEPGRVSEQLKTISDNLKLYDLHIDKLSRPNIFMNIKGYERDGKVVPYPNPIINGVNEIFEQYFYNGVNATITPYPTIRRPAFYSSANIFQFDKSNLNYLKITNVGEKEMYVDLSKVL